MNPQQLLNHGFEPSAEAERSADGYSLKMYEKHATGDTFLQVYFEQMYHDAPVELMEVRISAAGGSDELPHIETFQHIKRLYRWLSGEELTMKEGITTNDEMLTS
jgi:hypothetical protein